MSKATYKDAGVDLDIYRESMARLPRLMQRTFTPRVMNLEGGFAGLFQVDFNQGLFARTYKQPVLVSGTDGVGTKLQIAKRTGIHHTIGIDLVAMCVNDVLCCGAEPLFFLDYVAMSQDDPVKLEQIVQGISDGCVTADCSLLGGETAIMPDLYRKGDYDLAGFCVGIVEKDDLIDGSQMEPGDVVIGVASSGLHSNGFSLVRKIVFDIAGLKVRNRIEEFGTTVGEILLTPTRIYAQPVRRILKHYTVKNVVHGIAHVTGGGIQENLERVIPEGVHAELARNSWEIPPVFKWIQQLGDVDNEEMDRVFNLGIGLVLVVSNYYADNIQRILRREGLESWKLGEIKSGGSGARWA
ncbi:MAG: phosphoribosylformylglycinamidine cyclo-ligase [Pirellulaceae bacterium]